MEFIEGDKFLNVINKKLFEVISDPISGILQWVEDFQIIDGEDGEKGKDGNRHWYELAGAVIDDVTIRVEDYFVTTDNVLLQKLYEAGSDVASWFTIQEAYGAKGDTGSKGEKGDVGNTGAKGTRGEQGLIGPVGIRGSFRTAGTFDPVGVLADILEGDEHFNILNNTIWHVRDVDGILTWVKDVEITNGVDGDAGPQGEQGDIGPQGEQGLIGPVGNDGINGIRGNFTTSGTFDPILLSNQIKGDQYLNILTGSWWTLADTPDGLEWFKKIDTINGKDGEDGKTVRFNLQEISGDVTVDLNKVSQDYLSAVITGDTTITFDNLPEVFTSRV